MPDARGRREAVATAVRGQQGGHRSETRGGLPMPNAKVEARRNEKRIVALSTPEGTERDEVQEVGRDLAKATYVESP